MFYILYTDVVIKDPICTVPADHYKNFWDQWPGFRIVALDALAHFPGKFEWQIQLLYYSYSTVK